MKALLIIGCFAWLIVNVITSKLKSARQLYSMVFSGNCVAGKAFAMAFYMPAWILKAIREIVLVTIK